MQRAAIIVALILIVAPARWVGAAIIPLGFTASIDTGTLAGERFTGTLSYDTTGASGIGKEFLPLITLDFVLRGVAFTRADIKQGGQMITENGAPEYFTAAFFPPPPIGAPIGDIAFGFGGPGIIGTFDTATDTFGSGTYVLVPEPLTPAAALMTGLGFLGMALGLRRSRAQAG